MTEDLQRGRIESAAATEQDGHLTVAAVAARLGVAASTLRTWDRRYGLGPSGHQAGSHRRYSPDDLARLETMRALADRGVALVDAARMAVSSTPESSGQGHALDPLSLAAAAVEGDSGRLVSACRALAVQLGLVDCHLSRVVPALEILAGSERSDSAGHAPDLALPSAVLDVVRERVRRAVEPDLDWGSVLVVAPTTLLVAAHVLGGALHEEGVRARVARTDMAAANRHHRCRDGVSLVIELHDSTTAGLELHEGGREHSDAHDLLLVGAQAPIVAGAFRVRTLTAAVPEALDLVRARSQTQG